MTQPLVPYPTAKMGRPRARDIAPPNPSGLCLCGCGQRTRIATGTDTGKRHLRGEHVSYVLGHSSVGYFHPPDDHRLRNDAWFAGFVDGEGCFYIGGGKVALTIALRDDDAAILNDVRAAFGGCVRWRVVSKGNPQVRWDGISASTRALLLAYFDAFPLRSKKARDYVVWRRAACALAAGRRDELPALKDELRAARAYV